MRALPLVALLLAAPGGLAAAASPRAPAPPPSPLTRPQQAAPEPDGGPLDGFYFRLGGMVIAPTGRGDEVQLTNLTGMARLSGLQDGPISGSSTSLGKAWLPAAIVGYAPPILGRQLSIETVLALPVKQKLYAGGTLATDSISPTALGTLPTGVPALGTELGEVTSLPPVVTAVYRFFPRAPVRPYLGVGGCLLVVVDAKITNPVLASVRPPKVEIPPALGWVVQAGAEVRFTFEGMPGRAFFLTADVKYVGGLEAKATLKDVWVSVPDLPTYGAVKVGDNVSRLKVDPIVSFMGLGIDF
jgi:outer membrane protein W